MNRRNFISLMAGSAGAAFVPWRGFVVPKIFMPPDPELIQLSDIVNVTFGPVMPVRAKWNHIALVGDETIREAHRLFAAAARLPQHVLFPEEPPSRTIQENADARKFVSFVLNLE